MSDGIKSGPGILGGDIYQRLDGVLASPYEGLPSPVITTAWGEQLRQKDASDPDLERFIAARQQRSRILDPKGACTGGVGEPA